MFTFLVLIYELIVNETASMTAATGTAATCMSAILNTMN